MLILFSSIFALPHQNCQYFHLNKQVVKQSECYLKSDRAVFLDSVMKTMSDNGPGGEDEESLSSHGWGWLSPVTQRGAKRPVVAITVIHDEHCERLNCGSLLSGERRSRLPERQLEMVRCTCDGQLLSLLLPLAVQVRRRRRRRGTHDSRLVLKQVLPQAVVPARLPPLSLPALGIRSPHACGHTASTWTRRPGSSSVPTAVPSLHLRLLTWSPTPSNA